MSIFNKAAPEGGLQRFPNSQLRMMLQKIAVKSYAVQPAAVRCCTASPCTAEALALEAEAFALLLPLYLPSGSEFQCSCFQNLKALQSC